MATVRTVLGEISPDDLGITLSNEHLLLDTSHLFRDEPSPSDPPEIHALVAAPVPLSAPTTWPPARIARRTTCE